MLAEETPVELRRVRRCSPTATRTCASEPFGERRARLEAMVSERRRRSTSRRRPPTPEPARRSGSTRSRAPGLDGVVAKALDSPYRPGERTMVKVKHQRTADCVVAGYRTHKDGKGVGSLLLGLYDDEGEPAPRRCREQLRRAAARRARRRGRAVPGRQRSRDHPWREWGGAEATRRRRRMPGAASRWNAEQGPVLGGAAHRARRRGRLRAPPARPVPPHRPLRALAPRPRSRLVHVRAARDPRPHRAPRGLRRLTRHPVAAFVTHPARRRRRVGRGLLGARPGIRRSPRGQRARWRRTAVTIPSGRSIRHAAAGALRRQPCPASTPTPACVALSWVVGHAAGSGTRIATLRWACTTGQRVRPGSTGQLASASRASVQRDPDRLEHRVAAGAPASGRTAPRWRRADSASARSGRSRTPAGPPSPTAMKYRARSSFVSPRAGAHRPDVTFTVWSRDAARHGDGASVTERHPAGRGTAAVRQGKRRETIWYPLSVPVGVRPRVAGERGRGPRFFMRGDRTR